MLWILLLFFSTLVLVLLVLLDPFLEHTVAAQYLWDMSCTGTVLHSDLAFILDLIHDRLELSISIDLVYGETIMVVDVKYIIQGSIQMLGLSGFDELCCSVEQFPSDGGEEWHSIHKHNIHT